MPDKWDGNDLSASLEAVPNNASKPHPSGKDVTNQGRRCEITGLTQMTYSKDEDLSTPAENAAINMPKTFPPIRTYSLRINQHGRTSIRLEESIWLALKDIAKSEGLTIHEIATLVFERSPDDRTFTSSVRVFVVSYLYHWARKRGWPETDMHDKEILRGMI